MPILENRDYIYFTTTRGMCRHCRAIVPARVFFRGDQVWQQSLCPTCKNDPALIAADREWYLKSVLRPVEDHSPLKGSHPARVGCPHDCGPCAWHASPCQLPVVSITNVCNLGCPICFTYNRRDRRYFMPVEEMQSILDWIVDSSGPVDLINITGGEPALHPRILDLLDVCQRPEIGRVTMNSNGLPLAEDKSLCRELAARNVHVVLSFHTLKSRTSLAIHGRDVIAQKLKAIDNLCDAGARLTLLFVMIRGVNEDETNTIFRLFQQNDAILSLTVQTMTYTGQGGGTFPKGTHLPVDEGARIVCGASDGQIEFSDFVTRPSAHPLCYLMCYMFKSHVHLIPFTRFADSKEIEDLVRDSYLLRPEKGEGFIRDAIDSLYAKGETEHLKTFRRMLEALYPQGIALTQADRARRAESFVRTIRIHAHMDEDNFDCSRAMMCPDLVPAAQGRLIPACTYNLFYRMRDSRFYVEGK